MMASHPRKVSTDESHSTQAQAQCAIADQTEAFLRSGGTIQVIPNGVSGQIWSPVKPLNPAKKSKE